jgi:polyhydroxyalkanoate synthesis regulator phasin
MRTDAEQFIQDITRNLQEWSPYSERLSPEKLQYIFNRTELFLTRELASAVNELQREEE